MKKKLLYFTIEFKIVLPEKNEREYLRVLLDPQVETMTIRGILKSNSLASNEAITKYGLDLSQLEQPSSEQFLIFLRNNYSCYDLEKLYKHTPDCGKLVRAQDLPTLKNF